MAERHTAAPLLTERFQGAFALARELHATQVRKGHHDPVPGASDVGCRPGAGARRRRGSRHRRSAARKWREWFSQYEICLFFGQEYPPVLVRLLEPGRTRLDPQANEPTGRAALTVHLDLRIDPEIGRVLLPEDRPQINRSR
jgi:hypothetical protein